MQDNLPPKKLRLGILLNDLHWAQWQAQVMEQVLGIPGVEVAVLILPSNPIPTKKGVAKLLQHSDKWVWKLHESLDDRVFGGGDQLFKRQKISQQWLQIPQISVQVERTPFRDDISASDLERIKQLDLDVVVRFGFRILKGRFLQLARFGVWSYHHGDIRTNRGTPPGYWEFINREHHTGVTLQVLSPLLDGGQLLEQSICRVHQFSLHKNKAQIYRAGIPLLKYALLKLQYFGSPQIKGKPFQVYEAPLRRTPGNLQAIWGIVKHSMFFLRASSNKLRSKNWQLAYKFGDVDDIVLYKFQKIQATAGYYWADPFPVTLDDQSAYVFFEAYDQKTKKGHLSVGTLTKGAAMLTEVQTILESPVHYSYPCVFQHEDNWYMIPESAEAGEVGLYEATAFPYKWTQRKILLSGIQAVDTTPLFHKGRWYLFTTQPGYFGASKDRELHIYFSDDLLNGTWQPHPLNPVVNSVAGGRMAGHFVRKNNKLYRFAQDGSKRYGGGVLVFEIMELNASSYFEKSIESFFGDELGFKGLHTFNQSQSWSMFDVLQ